jgi:protein-disulfide isomerase
MKTRVTALALVLGALALPLPAETPGKAPLAVVGDVTITEADIAASIEPQMRRLRSEVQRQESLLRNQALDQLIGDALIEREAAARGIPVAALVKGEIADKAPLTPQEKRDIYQANKKRFGTMAEADALNQIDARVRPERERERRAAFVRELRQKGGVKVLLEPTRVAVSIAGRPIRGNPNAPVTIVEFSDFECPFCSRARPIVNQVRETYGDKVRVVFRNFPLYQIHAEAQKAAEAAGCAGEQGKFWEMHDRLFANQGKLQVPDLKAHAVALGLGADAFNQCLDSGKHGGDTQLDAQEGSEYGVNSTPAFFINGRSLVGAQPFETFAQLIDDELERVAAGGPSKVSSAPSAKPAGASDR